VVDGGAEVAYIIGQKATAGVQKNITDTFATRAENFDSERVALARKSAKTVAQHILARRFGISSEVEVGE
jgi:hypothetical protein